jgi:hypothetical protein
MGEKYAFVVYGVLLEHLRGQGARRNLDRDGGRMSRATYDEAPADLRKMIQKRIGGAQGLGPMAMGRGWTFRVPVREVNATIRVLEGVVPGGVEVHGQRDGRILVCDHRGPGPDVDE